VLNQRIFTEKPFSCGNPERERERVVREFFSYFCQGSLRAFSTSHGTLSRYIASIKTNELDGEGECVSALGVRGLSLSSLSHPLSILLHRKSRRIKRNGHGTVQDGEEIASLGGSRSCLHLPCLVALKNDEKIL